MILDSVELIHTLFMQSPQFIQKLTTVIQNAYYQFTEMMIVYQEIKQSKSQYETP